MHARDLDNYNEGHTMQYAASSSNRWSRVSCGAHSATPVTRERWAR